MEGVGQVIWFCPVNLLILCMTVECDEFGHCAYADSKEHTRQSYISSMLQCEFFRFNPHSKDFCLHKTISDLIQLIYNVK